MLLASYIPNRESVSTPNSICLERSIDVSIRLPWRRSMGPKTGPPHESSSIVSVAFFPGTVPVTLPAGFLFLLLALVPVTPPEMVSLLPERVPVTERPCWSCVHVRMYAYVH